MLSMRAGPDARLLEKEPVVGGLWAHLPAWQNIEQNRLQWRLCDISVDSEDQAVCGSECLAIEPAPNRRLESGVRGA